MITEGSKAPSFALLNQDGNEVSLASLTGKKVVLYFYPKDDTPGCTKEACAFRDNLPKFDTSNAVVLGVSPDSVKSHKKFVEKYNLPFQLLSDESRTMLSEYDVWKEKSMYGKKYMGVERTTVIIDEEGIIKKIFQKVKVEGHAEEVLEIVKG